MKSYIFSQFSHCLVVMILLILSVQLTNCTDSDKKGFNISTLPNNNPSESLLCIADTLHSEEEAINTLALLTSSDDTLTEACFLGHTIALYAWYYWNAETEKCKPLIAALEERVPDASKLPDDIRLRMYSLQGNHHFQLGNNYKSYNYFQKMLPLVSDTSKVWPHLLLNLAIAQEQLGLHELALGNYEKARIAYVKHYTSNDIVFGDLYNNMAVVAANRNDFVLSLHYLEEAWRIMRPQLPNHDRRLLHICINKGQAYSQLARQNPDLLDSAFYYLHFSDSIITLDDVYAKASIKINLAVTYKSIHNTVSRKYLKEAISMLDNTEGVPELRSNAKYLMAREYSDTDPAKSIMLLRDAIAIRKAHRSLDYRLTSEYNEMASIFLNLGQPDSAIFYTTSSFEANAPKWAPTPTSLYPGVTEVMSKHFFQESLALRVQALRLQYVLDTDPQHLKHARAALIRSFELIEETRRYFSPEGQQSFVAGVNNSFDHLYEVNTLLSKIEKNPTYIEELLQVAEQTKSIHLTQKMMEQTSKIQGDLSPEIDQNLHLLQTTLRQTEKDIMLAYSHPSTTADRIESLKRKVFYQKIKLDSVYQVIEQTHPTYYQMKYATDSLNLIAIQARLCLQDQVLVEYVKGVDYLYAFLVSPDTLIHTKIKLPADWDAQLTLWQAPLYHYKENKAFKPQQWAETGYKIQQWLWKPVIEAYHSNLPKRIVLVLDQELETIPFRLLPTFEKKEINSFKDIPYLLQSHSISRAYTAAMLERSYTRNSDKQKNKFLVLAPEFKPTAIPVQQRSNSKILEPLKRNQWEASMLSQLFPSTLLVKNGAKKDIFFNKIASHNQVWIGSHSIPNNAYPGLACIAFSPKASDQTVDLLYAHDLYNLNWDLDLFTISGCDANQGKLIRGEGVSSLTRAIRATGARSVVSTDWKADDRRVPKIMIPFYEKLATGIPKDIALQEAQLNFINQMDEVDRHPYFWATYVVYGNVAPLPVKTEISYWKWGILILIAGLCFQRYYQQRTSR